MPIQLLWTDVSAGRLNARADIREFKIGASKNWAGAASSTICPTNSS